MAALIRILLFIPRLIGRLFGQGGTAVRKASGNLVADAASADEAVETTPTKPYTFLFREIGRPRLPVVAASEFGLDAARQLVKDSDTYFSRPFSLFPAGSLFYEEVERQELEAQLGVGSGTEDAGFAIWTTEFRKVLNDNARRLLLWYTPMIAFAAAAFALLVHDMMPAAEVELPYIGARSAQVLAWPIAAFVGLVLLMLVYQWPYKFAQQRNLLGFDNTITSRFSQVNQNFQVAKRQALNVERNKRMNQVDELKEEAATWTLAYHWLAQRLLLSERLVRNQMYQANRNATLYSAGGFVLTVAIISVGAYVSSVLFPERAGEEFAIAVGSGFIFAATGYLLAMAGVAGETRRVLEDNEWFRFSRIELDRAVAEHVGEDKLQIITFRDRNRLE
ncbi:serine protease [Parvularcula sp. ZS-1/3]|uniref:Serine protease n=1 Tax=Parvularcula mediterranea TaxID=2732508 RepID=A0A7Y3RLK7_9PROT|nr:S1C family serine protease [Parvularcula mediterranea]NNU15582.1 serine protease [Parvularcula mediterranea]